MSTPNKNDWLGLDGKTIVVAGVANKRSVGFHVGKSLEACGARVLWVVRTEERKQELTPRLGDAPVLVCDVTEEAQVERLSEELAAHAPLYGLVHSIARAEYGDGWKPFHETGKKDFLRAVEVSSYSLIQLSNAVKELLDPDGAIVPISISTTRMAAEGYGYMAPVKASLDSTVVFLAKSFSNFSRVRVNAVCAGPLLTTSSAGIPGYLDNYLFAEMATLRKKAVTTQEVADTTLFLLSPRSKGINAQGVVIDAGMDVNYFDANIVGRATRPDEGAGNA